MPSELNVIISKESPQSSLCKCECPVTLVAIFNDKPFFLYFYHIKTNTKTNTTYFTNLFSIKN